MTLQTLTVRQLSTGTIYKLVACGSVCALVPLFTVIGLLATLGVGTVQWNGQLLSGLKGLLLSPFIGLLVALMITALVGSLIAFGLWLLSLLRPVQLTYGQDPT